LELVVAPLQLDDDCVALLVQRQNVNAVINIIGWLDFFANGEEFLADLFKERVRAIADELL
jgi:hypothetical protein